LPDCACEKTSAVQHNTQLKHSHHSPANRRFPLIIVANDLNSPLNVGSLFRLCDAFFIEKLYLCGTTPTPPNAKIKKTSRSTEKYVAYECHHDAEVLVSRLKNNDTLIVSLEITSTSLDIRSQQFSDLVKAGRPVCVILGSENIGIKPGLLALSDVTIHIPMYGNNSSMNVISAASIACFEIIRNM
jgi:tRNA G18 (ribose-2'-O)-methylase SpoU